METEVMNKVDKFVNAIKANTKPGPGGEEARLILQGPTKRVSPNSSLHPQPQLPYVGG